MSRESNIVSDCRKCVRLQSLFLYKTVGKMIILVEDSGVKLENFNCIDALPKNIMGTILPDFLNKDRQTHITVTN